MIKLFYQITQGDIDYLSFLKPLLVGKSNTRFSAETPSSIMQVVLKAKEHGASKVITCSPLLLKHLLDLPADKYPSLDEYAGSIIERMGVEFLITNPLEQLITTTTGKFLFTRYFSKFLDEDKWLKVPEFKWELFDPAKTDELIDCFSTADFIANDIETGPEAERIITCDGFTAVHIDKENGTFTLRTVVVPMIDMYNYIFCKIISDLPNPKCFQNGKYDNAYKLRYSMPVRNWAFDTAHAFHCWYSELPKDLGFITAFLVRKTQYWKNESKTSDLMQYYAYNAKDNFNTALCWLGIMQEMPDWGWNNYLEHEFPLVFPCLLAEMTGLKNDPVAFEMEDKRFLDILDKRLDKLRKLVGNLLYNPSSSQQTVKLFEALGCGDITKTTPAHRDKVGSRHPLNKRIVKAIEEYRKDRKLETSYLRDIHPKTKKQKSWGGRTYYSLNPHGTDTARLASKESSYWCGMQIQNIPRDRKDIQVKRCFVADAGFLFGEADYEQAEARDVAYLSGDTNLIAAVDDVTKDFHGKNASAFFGIAYDKIVRSEYDTDTAIWVHYVLDKDLRDLSKRTNHGANYNMGARVMLDTMGFDKVMQAKRLLRLPANYTALAVCQHLLDTYAATYPIVKGAYYDKIKGDVAANSMLLSPLGWTRYCFGNPSKSKQDLNAYVAHPSQNLNAGTLNLAWRKVFHNVWLPNAANFKLHAQIHDSILFSYRNGYEHLAWQVKDCMEFDVPVKDTFGIERILRVPVALKGNATRWSEVESMKCLKLEM